METVRDKNEGSVIFAGELPESVVSFIVPSDDSWSQKSTFSGVTVSIYADRKRFDKLDYGGAVYKLPPITFYLDNKFSGSWKEWTSRVAVKTTSTETHDSGLDAMIDAGVQVYFTDIETLRKIQTAPDHGLSIIKTLKSENQKQNQIDRPLP